MLRSSKQKQIVSGWLKVNFPSEYFYPLKFQKFLFLYESFAKIHGEETDFSNLKGYRNGPIFADVWQDYTHSAKEFESVIQTEYEKNSDWINGEWAKRAWFAAYILSDKELSEFTCRMNIWSA